MGPEGDELTIAQRGTRAVMGMVARSLAEASDQVTPPQLRALVLLRTVGRLQVGELGSLLGLSPSGATRAAARMERGGWLRRVRTADDRRAVALELTPRGTALVAGVLRTRETELRRALGRMGDDDRATVLRGLAILADAVDEPEDPATLQSLGFADGVEDPPVRPQPDR